jgi:predicted ATPase/DNA-binding CsgD family transcriptional regulator
MRLLATSPVMVGRELELEALREAQRRSAAGIPRGALVIGEAGIGKSRLLAEFVAGLGDGVVVAQGQCVQMHETPSPLQPIRVLLRELLQHFGAESLLESAGRARPHLQAVLPELTEGPPQPISQTQLHDAVSQLLQRLSERAELTLVVEDVHWADLATLDLLRSLLRTLRHGRVLIALSYRSEEVERQDPVSPLLVDLQRARDVSIVELRRLAPAETAEQVRHIRGDRADDEALAPLVSRSDGVPFFVEELLGLEEGGALPATLRELLLARYSRLPPEARALVRMVAVGGAQVPHELVAAVHGGDAAVVEANAREAVEAHVLAVVEAGYRFRHALTHEAVLEEILPGERRRIHARYAAALERMGTATDHAPLARHRLAAGDEEGALEALVLAAREARAAGALLAAAQLGEQAIALWPRVPDAEARTGSALSGLFLEVARAYDAAADARALPLLESAVHAVPETDALGRALLLHEAMIVRYGDALPGALEAAQQAHAQLPAVDADDVASLVRARVETGLGIIETIEHVPGGVERLSRAVASARALAASTHDPAVAHGARVEVSRGLSHLSTALATAGDVAGALRALDEARVHAGDDLHARLRQGELAASLHQQLGMHAEAVRLAEACRELAIDAGMQRGFGTEIAIFSGWSRLALGDLTGAEALLRTVRASRPPRTAAAYCAALEAELRLLADEPEAAAAALRACSTVIDDMRATAAGDDLLFARLDAELALAEGHLEQAWTAVERAWAWPRPDPGAALPLLALGARTLAALRRAAREPPGSSSEAAERRLRATLEGVARWEVAEDWRAVLHAELADEVDDWRAAAEAADRGRLPVQLRAHARRRLAAAHLREGDRDAAAAAIDDAAAVAERHGLRHAARLTEELAHHARLGARRRHEPDGTALTDRERQVLALIAQGLTNRQIAERLFISAKTASTHVSAILRKLGASTRAEAAGRAASLLD